MTHKEIKHIPGFEGKYGCDSKGNIFSLPRTYNNQFFPFKKMRKIRLGGGYVGVELYHNGYRCVYGVHSLIAKTFFREEEYDRILHKDGDRSNNSLSNLYPVKE